MKILSTVLALTLISICSTSMAQWQWLDKDGRKVFSDRAPSPEVPDKDILKRPNVMPKAAPPETRDAVENEGGAAAEGAPLALRPAPLSAGMDKDLEAKKKQMADTEAAKRKSEEERITKTKIENCARAKQAKTSFDSGARISRTNAAGEREVLDDATRAAELKHVQRIIQSECK